jgi:hypothetical protein
MALSTTPKLARESRGRSRRFPAWRRIFDCLRTKASQVGRNDVTYECFDNETWAGISIPKVACTSLRCWFRSVVEGDVYETYPQAPEVHAWYKSRRCWLTDCELGGKFSFAIVRHPASRALSAYQNKIVNPENRLFFRPEIRTLDAWLRSLLAEVEAGNPAAEWNEHWRPQTTFVPPSATFVGRLENFSCDMADICKRIGHAAPRWRNPIHMRTPKSTLSSGQLDLVKQIYLEDFRRFYPDGLR